MDTYFTCRNPHCEKYRNIFPAGSELHADCKAEPLQLGAGDETTKTHWLRFAIPLGVAAATAAAVLAAKPWKRGA